MPWPGCRSIKLCQPFLNGSDFSRDVIDEAVRKRQALVRRLVDTLLPAHFQQPAMCHEIAETLRAWKFVVETRLGHKQVLDLVVQSQYLEYGTCFDGIPTSLDFLDVVNQDPP